MNVTFYHVNFGTHYAIIIVKCDNLRVIGQINIFIHVRENDQPSVKKLKVEPCGAN